MAVTDDLCIRAVHGYCMKAMHFQGRCVNQILGLWLVKTAKKQGRAKSILHN